jgi:2-methylisocitrate lyase-like PEP mutase family enzyme
MAVSQREKGEAFRSLHEGDPFVIPNPWDAGSAKMLAGLGFKALATTSAGFAFTLGRPDGSVALEEICAHVSAIDQAADLPLSVDLENGYGPRPEDAARAIAAVAEAGAVGGSIEDFDRDSGEIYPVAQAVERIIAAVEAARQLDFPFTLTARAENFVHDNPDLDDTVARLRAFEDAGADVLYAPRLAKASEVKAICESVSKPVNVLAHTPLGMTLDEIAAAGGQRISVGGWLTWSATGAAIETAEKMLDGDFSGLRPPDGRLRDWL